MMTRGEALKALEANDAYLGDEFGKLQIDGSVTKEVLEAILVLYDELVSPEGLKGVEMRTYKYDESA